MAVRAVASIRRETSTPKQATPDKARDGDQVSRRAATDFQDPPARRRLQRADQPVTPEQEELAAEVVDMALPAIDPVHDLAVGGSLGHPPPPPLSLLPLVGSTAEG